MGIVHIEAIQPTARRDIARTGKNRQRAQCDMQANVGHLEHLVNQVWCRDVNAV